MSIKDGGKVETTQTAVKYPGLQHQADEGRIRGLLFQAVRRFLRAQFGRPTGFWGALAGKIMLHTPSNHYRTLWTISLLDIQPTDRLLEIGFGPGLAIELASRMAPRGFVAGVDHSEVMLRQAAKRNAPAIRDGKVELRLGSASQLPSFDQPFDKIIAINSIHFWTDPVECLKKLRTLLRPGGMIAITIQPRSLGATHTTAKYIGEEITANLELAGFTNCRLVMKQATSVPIACGVAIK
jgi:SAM-dependent methyltransferase